MSTGPGLRRWRRPESATRSGKFCEARREVGDGLNAAGRWSGAERLSAWKPCSPRRLTIALDPAEIIAPFERRWRIEVTFAETRTHLGVETQRQWPDRTISRTTPVLLGL